MKTYCDSQGLSIQLTQQIASSGEGEVWRTNRSGCLAKIYKSPTPQRISKLHAMVKNPPDDPTSSQNHISIVWPRELLYTCNRILLRNRIDCVGFLMSEIKQAKELTYVYHPQYRRQIIPRFNWRYLHATARNLASIVWALHKKGYIVGDMKPQNLLVNDRGLVSIIDTDSFQVTDFATKTVYRCPVGTEGFTPPELLGKDISLINQTEFHDRFRLAVIVYLLLFGYDPFTRGKWIGSGEPPELNKRVKEGLWLYAPKSEFIPDAVSIPLNVVYPEIQNLFFRCFNDGHKNPSLRPSAQEWCNALDTAISQLTLCSRVDNHIYTRNYGRCYWCERANQLNGIDIFYVPNSNSSVLPPSPVTSLKEKFNIWIFNKSNYLYSHAVKTLEHLEKIYTDLKNGS